MMAAVLHQEMLLGSRRSRTHVLRWVYAGWLLLQGFFFLMNSVGAWWIPTPFWERFAGFAYDFTHFFLQQHFVLLLLVTPALTGGAIAEEKTRGTLTYLLTSPLEPWEVVVGKLLGRVYHVLLLAMVGLPLLMFFGPFAGLEWWRLAAIVGNTLVVAWAVAAAGVLASVWCRNTRDAVLSLYSLGLAGILVWPVLPAAWLPIPARWLNPAFSLAEEAREFWPPALLWTSLAMGCLVLACWRLRSAYTRQLENSGRPGKHWWTARRPAVSDRPLLWKERHVEGVAPLSLLRRAPAWLGILLVLLIGIYFASRALLGPVTIGEAIHLLQVGDREDLMERIRDGYPTAAFYMLGMAGLFVFSLVVAMRCSGAVTGERERQTWEALLLTPLPERELIRGKWWGILGAVLPYLGAFALPTLLLASLADAETLWWVLFWLLLTLLSVAYAGAVGLWCSVRSTSSWRSLLGTLAYCYVAAAIMYLPASCVGGLLVALVLVGWTLLELVGFPGDPLLDLVGWAEKDLLQVCIIVALAAGLLILAWRLLVAAEYRVGILERTRDWSQDPEEKAAARRRRRRRRLPV